MQMHLDVRQFLRDPRNHDTCRRIIHKHQEKAGVPPTRELLGQSIWRGMVRDKTRNANATGSGAAAPEEPRPKRAATAKAKALKAEKVKEAEEAGGSKRWKAKDGEEGRAKEGEEAGEKSEVAEGAEEEKEEEAEEGDGAKPRRVKQRTGGRQRSCPGPKEPRKLRKLSSEERAEGQAAEKAEKEKDEQAEERNDEELQQGTKRQGTGKKKLLRTSVVTECPERHGLTDSRVSRIMAIAPAIEYPGAPNVWMRDPRLSNGETSEQRGWQQCGCNGTCGRQSCPGRRRGYMKGKFLKERVPRLGCPNPALSLTQLKPRCASCVCRADACERYCGRNGFCSNHQDSAMQVLKRPAANVKRPSAE